MYRCIEKKALALQKGSGKKIGEVLVDNGFITEDMIVRALQMQLGLKVVQLTGVTIPKEVRNLVSVDILKKYTCIPFERDPYNANILHLAMADPMDMAAIDDISIVTNLQVEPYIATTRDILAAIDSLMFLLYRDICPVLTDKVYFFLIKCYVFIVAMADDKSHC